MAQLIEKRISGSTLIEVLVAMVIIMAVFTISLRVFNNVLSSSVSLKKVKVSQQLGMLLTEARQMEVLEDQLIEIDSISYSYEFNESDINGLIILNIKAKEHGKLLGEVKCLLKNKRSNED